MTNPWTKSNSMLSLWLSAANAWAGAARGFWTGEFQRWQSAMLQEGLRQGTRFWTGGRAAPTMERGVRLAINAPAAAATAATAAAMMLPSLPVPPKPAATNGDSGPARQAPTPTAKRSVAAAQRATSRQRRAAVNPAKVWATTSAATRHGAARKRSATKRKLGAR
jgi:hypothetical protein